MWHIKRQEQTKEMLMELFTTLNLLWLLAYKLGPIILSSQLLKYSNLEFLGKKMQCYYNIKF